MFMLGVVFLIYNKNNIKADSNLGIFKSKKDFRVVLDGQQIKFSIKSYSQNSINRNYLFKNTLFRIKQTELFGFEDDINLCNRPIVKLGEKEVFCLIGDVGVHSQNIVFFDKDISPIEISEGENISKNLITDSPNYQLLDYNNDKTDDLIIENRDYDKNPLSNIIRKYYIGTNSGFVFDKEEYVEVK